ncbi:replicative DNA helicase [Patescibacteria group bacterium]|nr:replicative DNA helicase [Patescibacteria group bacterium]
MLDKIDQSLPPQNIEAEESVLGSLMIDKEAIIKIADIVKAEDFYKESHGAVFEAMIDLYEKREPIDVVSLSNVLQKKNKLEEIGGRSKLVTLANVVPTAGNVIHYAKIVQQKSTLRRLQRTAGEISELAHEETTPIEKVLDSAEQKLFSVSQKYLKNKFTPIKSILTDTFERIDELHKDGNKLRGIPTGFVDLDNLLAGFQKSDLVILAARPSMGKTAFALDLCRQIAVKSKVPTGIFSLEMSKEQLVDRLLCAQAGVDLWKMRTGKLSDSENSDDFPRVGQAMGILSEAPIFIDDTPSANAMEIRTKARRLQSEHGLGLVVVDYLQLMEGRNPDNRVQEISEISRSLKGIARELDIPVLALSQLSRAVENRSPQIPQLSDLRESGSIEQDADVVMFIYREVMYNADTENKNIAEIHIKKHRNGPTGKVDLYFNHDKVRFENLKKSS